MYKNLLAEMARKGIINSQIASKRQINRDEEKENRAGWSQEKHPAW